MKKILIAGVVVVAAVALAGPRVVGLQFESQVNSIVASVNDMPLYRASVTTMDSGWFSSTAEVNIGMDIPGFEDTELAATDFSFNILVEGNHGPILTADGFAIGWLHTQIKTNAKKLPDGFVAKDDAPIYSFNGVTGLFGGTAYKDVVAPFTYTDTETQTVVEFSGMNGNGNISGNTLSYASTGDSLNMDIGSVLTFNMNSLSLDMDAKADLASILNQELYDSVANITIASMSFNNSMDNSSSEMENMRIDIVSDYDEANDLADIKFGTKLASVISPETTLKDLVLDIEVNNIQGAFITAYNKLSGEMLELATEPDASMALMQTFMQEYALGQLQAEPEYNFTNISGKINDSDFSGNIAAKLTGITELPATMEDPSFWLEHALVDSKMTMQKGAALYFATQMVNSQLAANPQFMAMSPEEQKQIVDQQAVATLDGLAQQGMVTVDGETYELIFTMEDSVALLNGNPIPL
ncbi:YdgA family protein [Glaciecola petra]|uniref:DUF945 family protein n=1 Tax=Glaciecola petra TaxID=3075602 RepID=A0ABU2ZVL4_9ALTE|nr:DUF945 family protein [Aestuariibacter sp. P117]MDT0596421.1 DUF945 family protein [Aestuariibacter sp. P117]